MSEARIKKLIDEGEGVSVEFKECRSALGKPVYRSICAFLNRNGGDILLGVNDRGKITGIVLYKIIHMIDAENPDVLAEEILENLEAGVESFKQIIESINGQ